jgi:hypothetical protein
VSSFCMSGEMPLSVCFSGGSVFQRLGVVD